MKQEEDGVQDFEGAVRIGTRRFALLTFCAIDVLLAGASFAAATRPPFVLSFTGS